MQSATSTERRRDSHAQYVQQQPVPQSGRSPGSGYQPADPADQAAPASYCCSNTPRATVISSNSAPHTAAPFFQQESFAGPALDALFQPAQGADVVSHHAAIDSAPADSSVSGNKQRRSLTTTVAIVVTIGQGSGELSAGASGLRPRQRAGSVASRIARRSQPAHRCRDPGYLRLRTPPSAAGY